MRMISPRRHGTYRAVNQKQKRDKLVTAAMLEKCRPCLAPIEIAFSLILAPTAF